MANDCDVRVLFVNLLEFEVCHGIWPKKLDSPLKLWNSSYVASYNVSSVVFSYVFNMLSPLTVFRYQILLLPICSCILFEI